MASVAVACPTTTAYRLVRPHLFAASSTLSHAFCPPVQKARVFAPVLGSWCGLRRLRLSPVEIRSAAVEKKGTCRRMVVYASLFGVGAPEVLVIGVVALLVFGPKGLAEVARTLGKTLKAFQPTIRELQEVSRDFKTTLEREIGLDEDTTSMKTENRYSTGNPQEDVNLNGSPSFEEILRASREQLQASATTTTSAEVEAPATKAYTSEELLKVTEEQPAASATAQQSEHIASEEESQAQPFQSSAAAPEIAIGTPAPQRPESKSENET